MTLRHRFLLVYLIVVLLSVATVGVALFELGRSRQIIRELQDWNRIVLNFEKLRSAWPPDPSPDADELALRKSLIEQFRYLARAPVYLDVDPVREALGQVYSRYDQWQRAETGHRLPQYEGVRASLAGLGRTLDDELAKLNMEAQRQDVRTRVLLAVVIGLTALHVLAIGWLLRRWLLRPMERLNRQVDALARDEPPPEPLLTEPLEMANLARALDRARRSLGDLRRQLIESERLTTIGQFAAQLAHNLRNPLASIRAAAQVSARHEHSSAYVRERMDEILASVDRLNRWIGGLMEVARREPTPTRSADVVPMLYRVRDALAPELASKELTLTIDAPQAGLICPHDPDTLEHALIAMIVNAIEASPLGEAITVRAEHVEGNGQRPAICRISVVDYGTGLPADAPDRIFEFSFSSKQRGMGLGLALARQALQRQGGSAHARNNPDRGATIYVELPIQSSAELPPCRGF